MVLRRIITFLVAAAVVLPIAVAVILGVARLLGGMGDDGGRQALDRVALVCGILWALDLVTLVTVQGINSLLPPSDRQ